MKESIIKKFLQYGVSSCLADKAASNGLTVTKVTSLPIADLVSKYGVTAEEAQYLVAAVRREPIEERVLGVLLERSNFTCNVCKGVKGHAYVVHHIEEYSVSQDNSYQNLIVLCPNDHDLAHRSGLTLGITKKSIARPIGSRR